MPFPKQLYEGQLRKVENQLAIFGEAEIENARRALRETPYEENAPRPINPIPGAVDIGNQPAPRRRVVPKREFKPLVLGPEPESDLEGQGKLKGGIKYTRKQIINTLKIQRKRTLVPQSIIANAVRDAKKIEKIPYKKASKEMVDMYKWGDNPSKEPSLGIDLPILKVDAKDKAVAGKTIFYTPAKLRRDGFKIVKDSCIVVSGNEIITIYINSKGDKAVSEAGKHLKQLGADFVKYFPRKSPSFYTRFGLSADPVKQKEMKKKYAKDEAKDKYYGWNALDGMINHFSATAGGNVFDFHPRSPEAMFDSDFLYRLIYTYTSIYELEKRYAPAVADYRLQKAKEADKIPAIPNMKLNDLPATSLGASKDFASALHDDSGIKGITETIIWSEPDAGKKQYFVNAEGKLAFDLSDGNSLVLIPPKIAHGTANTGAHGGFGFVIITKANLVSTTDFSQKWYNAWRDYLTSEESKLDFKKAVEKDRKDDSVRA
jgi:hypothetical protein